MSLDAAVIESFTQGINAPSNGEQGYVVFADQQSPQPNLTYKSATEAGAALKNAIVQTVDAKSAEPATIAASGTHQISVTQPTTPYCVFEYVLRAQVRVGTTMQWYARRRFTVTTDSAGLIAANHDISESTIGSGFTLTAATPGPTAVALNVASLGAAGVVFASITETYRKAITPP